MNQQSLPWRYGMITDVLLLAVWFGLVTGLLEGWGFLAFQQFGRLTHVTLEIVWIAMIFNVFLFSLAGLALAALTRFFSKGLMTPYTVFLFAFLAGLDWLAVACAEHLHYYSVALLALGVAVQFMRWFRRHEMATVRFWRRSLPWVVTVVLLTLAAIQGRLWLQEQVAIATLPPAPSESPNILVILVDALRADHLSCYGYARPTSPNVDRITQQGVLFEKAFPTSSWTLPSHASLLTGRYPYEHGADWSKPQALLDRRHPTLAEALRSRGYRTAAFSANLFWFTRPMGFGRGFIRFEDYFHSIGDMASRTLYGRVIEKFVLQRLGFEDIPARKRASDINRSLLNWADGERNKPFFAFLNYMDTHDPYLPPQPYRDQFSKLKNPGGILNWRVGRNHPPMTAEQLQSEIDAYDGAVAYVDDHIGKLLIELQKRGLADNMLVVITSDHGESFGEHGVFLHGNGLYREEIQVPLILRWPGQVPAGMRVASPITNAALPATVMDLLGAGDQTVFPGPSLSSLWKASQAYSNFPYPLAEIGQIPWAPENAPTHHGSMISLVSPQWHYIEHAKLGLELYTWENDPRERHNLADRSELQNVVSQLRLRLPQTSSGMERGPILHGRPTEHSVESRH